MVQSALLFYLLWNIFNTFDQTIIRDKMTYQYDGDWMEDIFKMPVAKHRLHMNNAKDMYYFMHPTNLSMPDFVRFVVKEST